MKEFDTSTVVRTDALKVLIVDDDKRDRELIEESINGVPWVVCNKCKSLAEVAKLPANENFNACILDILFNKSVDIWGLLDLVKGRFAQAVILIVSDHLDELNETQPPGVAAMIAKPHFKSDRSLLRAPLIESLRERSDVSETLLRRVKFHFDDLKERDECGQVEPLFEMTGYVLEVREPFIEVMVEEAPKIRDRVSQFLGISEPTGKRLLMRYDVFKASGIVAPDMPFCFRVFRRDNEIVSKVLPISEPPETVKLDESLSRLKVLQAAKRKEKGLDHE